MSAIIASGLALSIPSSQSTVQVASKDPPTIELESNGPSSWTATYRMFAPTNELVFLKDSSGKRNSEWIAGGAFEIVGEGPHDVLRRKDGSPFATASVTVPTTFNSAAGGYAPFVHFSDKSLLVYTGQFLTCPDRCPDRPTWKWNLTADVGSSKAAIADGRVRRGRIAWTESRKASYLFVGNTKPIESRSFTAVIDPSVPASISSSLRANFPKFMQFYAQHLGPPAAKPTVFVSYDEHDPDTGSAGTNVSNDISMHLYGAWPTDPDWPSRVTWYFAHEAGHDFQKTDTSQSPAEWWIHEGAAEEFAALALQQASPELAAYAQTRLQPARSDCADGLRQLSLHDALANGHHDLDYPCGLVLQARFDRDIRTRNPKSDGIFALWRDYRQRLKNGAPPVTETYLASVEALAGKDTADWAHHIIYDRLSDPAAALAKGAD